MTTMTPWSSPFLVNSNTTGDHYDIKLQALADGRFVTVWTDNAAQAFIRLFDANGTPKTGDIAVTLAENDGQKFVPTIALLNNGNFVVAWEDASQNDGDQDTGIRAQIFSPDGTKVGTDIHINGIVAYTQAEIQITPLADGGFAVVYLDYPWDSVAGKIMDSDSSDLVTKVFNASGVAVSGDIAVNTTRPNGQTEPAITTTKDGGYAIFFADSSQTDVMVRGRYFAADGTPKGADFLVAEGTGGQNNPTATTLADGKIVVTWETSSGDIVAQMLAPDGTAFGETFVIDRGMTAGQQEDAQVVALKDGGFAVSFTSTGAGNSAHVAFFTGTGEFVQDYAIDPAPETEFPGGPGTSLTALADGRIAIAWTSSWAEDYYVNFHAQIFDPRSGAVSLHGSNANDHFFGTAFDDVVDGGAGVDTLEGGVGDDTYFVDNASDVIVEAPSGGGFDTVVTSANYSLSSFVEKLVGSGMGALSLTGNDLNNLIVGNAGDNVIDGGAGADVMQGGAGNDTYRVDIAGDVVVDEAGSDTVVASVSYALTDGLENLVAAGAGSVILTGNAGRNAVIGNVGDNRLAGKSGNDVLTGGAGKDAFILDTRLGTSKTDRVVNFDRITDFKVGQDKVWLDNAIFKKLGKAGSLTAPVRLKANYFSLDKARDKDDYLIYNRKTGVLSYDADGSGSQAAIEIAQLSKGLKLTYKDFYVI
jgi:Ca2+-binding RTX toxin-like protein